MYGNLGDSHLFKGSLWPQDIAAAGTVNGTGIDCLGYETLTAIVLIGDVGQGTLTVKLQESSDDAVADAYADITSATTGAVAPAGDDEVYLIDVNLSERERYIRAVVTDAGGANANEVACVFALFKGRHLPPTQENTVVEIGYS